VPSGAQFPEVLEKRIITRSLHPDKRPLPGDLVRIHYIGRLPDGTVFDSSRARQKPFEFILGDCEVIDGWEMLIGSMAYGERADLMIPPQFAYGEDGVPPIVPPNATLTFNVELLDFGTPIDQDSDQPKEEGEEEEADSGGAPNESEQTDSELYWEKDPEREAGRGPGYTWQASPNGDEILVTVPLPKDVTVKDLGVHVGAFSLKCKVKDQVIIDDEVFADVNMDDSHWDLEKRGTDVVLIIGLAKIDRQKKWESLRKGGDPELVTADVVSEAATSAEAVAAAVETVDVEADVVTEAATPAEAVPAAVETVDVEVIDVDEALRLANEASRRAGEANAR